MSQIEFYTNAQSRGRIAHWMIEETGAAYTTHWLNYGPEMQSDAYAAINPMRKVPAIVHDGNVITEGAAICAYLAEAFPDAGLAPKPNERAAYFRWMFFAAGPWEAATTNQSLGFVVPEGRSAMAGYGDFDRALSVFLSAVPETGFLCGPRFTAADVYAGSQVLWGNMFGSIPASPKVDAYLARLKARPAYQRADAMNEAKAAETPTSR